MDFQPSAEQTALRDTVHRYLKEHYSFPQRRAMLKNGTGLDRQRWLAYAQLGLLGAGLPEELGGSGDSPLDASILAEEFGRFMVLEPLLSCAGFPARVLIAGATQSQRDQLLPQLIAGERLFAVAHSESPARGDVYFVDTRAVALPGGRFLLNGHKAAVIGGGDADKLIVSARIGGANDAPEQLSLFLLDPAMPGITRRNYRTIDGRLAAEITLTAVEAAPEALLGADGGAAAAILNGVEHFIVGCCAEAVGVMDAVVTTTVDYLKTRRAYGATLSTYQALQHRLADMLAELELSRSMLIRALYALTTGDDYARRRAVSGARLLVGRAGRFITSSGIQLHGAMGVVDEHVIGNYLKRLGVTFALCGSVNSHLRQYAALCDGSVAARE